MEMFLSEHIIGFALVKLGPCEMVLEMGLDTNLFEALPCRKSLIVWTGRKSQHQQLFFRDML